jgi:hypothetical protein
MGTQDQIIHDTQEAVIKVLVKRLGGEVTISSEEAWTAYQTDSLVGELNADESLTIRLVSPPIDVEVIE